MPDRSWQWHISATAGLLSTGVYRPLCSIVWDFPDCPPRRVYLRRMDRLFSEAGHCIRIHVQWVEQVVMDSPRRAYDPPPVEGVTGPKAGY